MTKKPLKKSAFKIDDLSFRWQDMNIFLEAIVEEDGNKFLKLKMAGVGAAVLITESPTESWTISVVGEKLQGVGVLRQSAALISVGPAQNVTANATADTQDLEPSND